jgi:hypothetical protein
LIFGKSFGDYVRFVRTGLVLLVAMGLVRFVLGVSGVAYERATHLTSVTVLVFLLAVVYGQRAAARGFGRYRQLIPIAILLSCTMYGFIVVAIAVEGLTGWHGWFHAPGAGFAPHGMGVSEHIFGQLSVMGTMTVAILGTTAIGYVLWRYLAHLRNAFLLLAVMAIVRFAAGPAGIPHAAGTWITSLVLFSVVLAAWFAYRVPTALDGYRHMLPLAVAIAFVAFHLMVYGFVISEGLDVPTYYNAPVADGTTAQEFIMALLKTAPLLVAAILAASCLGLALGRRRAENTG